MLSYLSVWPRNGFSRKFPNETWENLETPCKSWPAPRPPCLPFQSEPCRLVMLRPVPRAETIPWQGHLCPIWTWPSYVSLPSASYPVYRHFTCPLSAISHAGRPWKPCVEDGEPPPSPAAPLNCLQGSEIICSCVCSIDLFWNYLSEQLADTKTQVRTCTLQKRKQIYMLLS